MIKRKIAGLNLSGLGVKLPLRHLFDPGKWRKIIMIIREDILERYQSEEDIHFACQTYRFSGKPGEGRTQKAEVDVIQMQIRMTF